jgi:hypothetical protein
MLHRHFFLTPNERRWNQIPELPDNTSSWAMPIVPHQKALQFLPHEPQYSPCTPPQRGPSPPKPSTASSDPLVHTNHAVSSFPRVIVTGVAPNRNLDDVVQDLVKHSFADPRRRNKGCRFQESIYWTAGWLIARQPCRSCSPAYL